jgi:hypothetical protein
MPMHSFLSLAPYLDQFCFSVSCAVVSSLRQAFLSRPRTTVSLFQRYGKGGDNSKLKAWAITTLPTLQHHLDMAEGLDR